MRPDPFKTAFIGFGEVNSPKDLIITKCSAAIKEVQSLGFDLVSTDPVTDAPEGNDVRGSDSIRTYNVIAECDASFNYKRFDKSYFRFELKNDKGITLSEPFGFSVSK